MEKGSKFFEEAFEHYPSIVANEYYRLKILHDKQDTYGTMLQIKDVFEVMIKVPVLVIMNSLIYMIKNHNAVPNEVIEYVDFFTSRPFSLGHWEQLGHRLKNISHECFKLESSDFYILTIKNLKMVLKKFSHGKIVKWRNDSIGHGALKLEDDEMLNNEICKYINIINDVMKASKDYFSSVEFVTSKGKYLKGTSSKELAGDEKLSILYDKKTIPLDPLISHLSGGLYLFDSYQPYKGFAYMLNYSHGMKIESPLISKEIKAIRDILKINNTSNDNIMGSFILNSDLKKIESLLDDNNIVNPEYWDDLLLASMGLKEHDNQKSYSKGVFLLRAERGMGKTYFTRIIDELNPSINLNTNYESVIVRVFHINSHYNSKISNFKSKLKQLLKTIVDDDEILYNDILGEDANLIDRLVEIENNEENDDDDSLEKNIAKIYNESFKILKWIYRKEKRKFLFVLDGVDELDPKYLDEDSSQMSILDYIPKPELLDDGVYILLTSRIDKELENASVIRDKINSTDFTNVFETSLQENSPYIEALKKYLNKHNIKENQEQLLAKLEHRFSYVALYTNLLSKLNNNSIDMDIKDLLRYHLDNLKESNIVYYQMILKLLLTLAIFPDGLDLERLIYMMDETTISYRFIAIINDHRNFIRYERSNKGTKFYLSHVEWNQYLLNNFKEEISQFVLGLKKKKDIFIDLIKNGELEFSHNNNSYDSEMYLLSTFYWIGSKWIKSEYEIASSQELKEYISDLYMITQKLDNANCYELSNRNIKISITNLYRKVKEPSGNELRIIVDISLFLCKFYRENEKRNEMVYKQAIEARDALLKLEAQGEGINKYDLGLTYYFAGKMNKSAKFNVEKRKEAIAQGKLAEEIFEKYFNNDIGCWKDLIETYKLLGDSVIGSRIESSLEYYEKIIEILELLEKNNIEYDHEELALAYKGMGDLHGRVISPTHSKDIEWYKESIKTYRQLIESDTTKNLAGYNEVLSYVARYYELNRDYESSLKYRLKQKSIFDRCMYPTVKDKYIQMYKIYDAIAKAYSFLDEKENLKDSYQQVKKVLREWEKEYKRFNSYGRILSNQIDLGRTYRSFGEYEKALEMYEEAIELSKKYGEALSEYDKEFVFLAYVEMSSLMLLQDNSQTSEEYLKNAITCKGLSEIQPRNIDSIVLLISTFKALILECVERKNRNKAFELSMVVMDFVYSINLQKWKYDYSRYLMLKYKLFKYYQRVEDFDNAIKTWSDFCERLCSFDERKLSSLQREMIFKNDVKVESIDEEYNINLNLILYKLIKNDDSDEQSVKKKKIPIKPKKPGSKSTVVKRQMTRLKKFNRRINLLKVLSSPFTFISHEALMKAYTEKWKLLKLLKRYEEALEILHILKDMYLRKGDNLNQKDLFELTNIYLNIGRIYYNQEKYQEAMVIVDKGIELIDNINDVDFSRIARSMVALYKLKGDSFGKLGNNNFAIEEYFKMISVAKTNNFIHKDMIGRISEALDVYIEKNDYDRALNAINKILSLIENDELDDRQVEMYFKSELYERLATVYDLEKDKRKAMKYYIKGMKYDLIANENKPKKKDGVIMIFNEIVANNDIYSKFADFIVAYDFDDDTVVDTIEYLLYYLSKSLYRIDITTKSNLNTLACIIVKTQPREIVFKIIKRLIKLLDNNLNEGIPISIELIKILVESFSRYLSDAHIDKLDDLKENKDEFYIESIEDHCDLLKKVY